MSLFYLRFQNENQFDLGEISQDQIDKIERILNLPPCALYGPPLPSEVRLSAKLTYSYDIDPCDIDGNEEYITKKTDKFIHLCERVDGPCPMNASVSGWFSIEHIQNRFGHDEDLARYLASKASDRLDENLDNILSPVSRGQDLWAERI